MLSGLHFYHRTSRKLVVAFGTIFNNVRLVRYNNEGTVEIERVNVPISDSSKEKFYQRITADPELTRQTQIELPRLAFELMGMTYDPLRKVSSHNDYFYSVTGGTNRLKMVPYNFDFNVYLFVRNIEEGYQIIEQIMPYFAPDYTITVNFLDSGNLKLDVPIVFNGITPEIDDEGGPDPTRMITYTLNFTMKAYVFGPATNTKLITDARGNVYTLADNTFDLNNGNGFDYRLNELVYQGRVIEEADAVGYVRAWSNTTNTISLFDVNGRFTANNKITGYLSGAKYNLSTVLPADQLLEIKIRPDPLTANANDDFGFITTITRNFP
jgi:hypothetical protein